MNSFKDKLRIAWDLSSSDWLALAEAWWGLLRFHFALRWTSFDRLNNSIQTAPEEMYDLPSALLLARKIQRLVFIASRLHFLSMPCLVQAFTLRTLLNRREIPSELRIGANKISAGIHAHAWVEIQGTAIGEPEDISERFRALSSVKHIVP